MRKDDDDAPGLKVRQRTGGDAFYWVASAVTRKAGGYPVKTVRLHYDTHEERAARCRVLTAELRQWLAGQGKRSTVFTGSLHSLITCYQQDEDSPYRDVKWNTREHYDDSLGILDRAVGKRRIADLTRKDFARWHKNFKAPAEPGGPERLRRAYNAMKLLRIIRSEWRLRWKHPELLDQPRRPRNVLPPGPMPTLGQMREHGSWLWVYCQHPQCGHSAAVWLDDVIARCGEGASADVLRRRARCAVCGSRGAALSSGGIMGPYPEERGPLVPIQPEPIELCARMLMSTFAYSSDDFVVGRAHVAVLIGKALATYGMTIGDLRKAFDFAMQTGWLSVGADGFATASPQGLEQPPPPLG